MIVDESQRGTGVILLELFKRLFLAIETLLNILQRERETEEKKFRNE